MSRARLLGMKADHRRRRRRRAAVIDDERAIRIAAAVAARLRSAQYSWWLRRSVLQETTAEESSTTDARARPGRSLFGPVSSVSRCRRLYLYLNEEVKFFVTSPFCPCYSLPKRVMASFAGLTSVGGGGGRLLNLEGGTVAAAA